MTISRAEIDPDLSLSVSPFVQLDGRRITSAPELEALGLTVEVRSRKDPPWWRHHLTITNTGAAPRLVERVGAELAVSSGPGPRLWRVFLDRGECGWCGVKRLDFLDDYPHLPPVQESRGKDASTPRITTSAAIIAAAA